MFTPADRDRLASVESTVKELKEYLIGNGDTGRIPKLEKRVSRLEQVLAWGAGIVAGVKLALAMKWKT